MVFSYYTSVGEIGISPPYGESRGTDQNGTFINNWEGYGDPYWGDKRLTWRVQIDAAGFTGSATYKYSQDSGASWEEEGIKTGTNWKPLGLGVQVRFEGWAGTAYADGDYWQFDTVPLYVPAEGDPIVAKAREIVRS